MRERVAAAFKGLALGLVAGVVMPFAFGILLGKTFERMFPSSLDYIQFLSLLVDIGLAIWLSRKQKTMGLVFGVVSFLVSAIVSFFLMMPGPPD